MISEKGAEGRLPILEERGARIANIPRQIIRINANTYRVKSQSSDGWYDVTWQKRFWRCECPFNVRTKQTCKHVYAVLHRITETQEQEGSEVCPECNETTGVIGRGFYKSKHGLTQRFGCKKCRIRFSSRTGFKGMKHTASVITAAMDLYFRGMSLRSISNHFLQIDGQQISHLTIYRWIRRYTMLIKNNLATITPQVSTTWHADEMRINVDGRLRNLWNLMDHETRYKLAVQVTKRKRTADAERLLSEGLETGKPDKLTVISDGLDSYKRSVQNCSQRTGLLIQHKADTGLKSEQSNNMVERLNGTVRQRVKTMRGLDNDRSARIFADGFRIFYNHVRPHSSLNGQTPGDAANAWHSDRTNRWVSLINYGSERNHPQQKTNKERSKASDDMSESSSVADKDQRESRHTF